MTLRFLVNFGLLALPIGITLGILFSLQSHNIDIGKPPPFAPSNKIDNDRYCQKAFGIHPESKGQEYTLNPNQWGWDEGDEGSLCLNVTTHRNHTYATKTIAPKWSVTWQYPRGPMTDPVHAFPNIKVEDVLPLKVSAIEKIDMDFEWTYGKGKTAAPLSKNVSDLWDTAQLNANVAMDMFLDLDEAKSKEAEKASHEIMVWFAAIGPSTQPIGFNDGVLATKTLDGVEFKLYNGTNTATKQKVLTWYVETPAEEFNGDVRPLVEEIIAMKDEDFPTSAYYMGYLSWGTEAYDSNTTVTFDVPRFAVDITTA